MTIVQIMEEKFDMLMESYQEHKTGKEFGTPEERMRHYVDLFLVNAQIAEIKRLALYMLKRIEEESDD